MRWLFVFLSLMLASVATQAADSEVLAEQAHEVVREKTEELMTVISRNRYLYGKNQDKFFNAMDQVLGPVVDFKRLTRRIMGKYYRASSVKQRKRFAQAFKKSLLNSYAKGLIEFDNYEVKLLSARTEDENSLRNTLVDLEVITPSGKEFPITQSMYFQHKERRWMMQNVIVGGINVGKLFRTQFYEMVQQNEGNIDGAIDAWIEAFKQQGAKLRNNKASNRKKDTE